MAVTLPGSTAARAIPTMERRDRSSLGRLVMPDTAAAATGRLTADTGVVTAAPGGTRDTEKSVHVRQPAADTSAAASYAAASDRSSKLGVRPTIVKRTSNSRKAQLALKRRRIDYNVKLILSEPVGTK